MMLSQVTRFSNCTSYRWKCSGCVSTPLCVSFQISVPSVPTEIGVILSVVGKFVPSKSSVGGFTNG